MYAVLVLEIFYRHIKKNSLKEVIKYELRATFIKEKLNIADGKKEQ